MKFIAIIFLVVVLLASLPYSAPTVVDKSCNDVTNMVSFNSPIEGDVLRINNTEPIDFELNKYCYDIYGIY